MRVLLPYVAGTLLALAFLAYGPGPEAPTIKVAAPTPEVIKAQIENEYKQRQYDRAEEVAAHVMRRNGCSDEYAEAIAHSAVDNGLSARVLAALAFVESTCRANAVSGRKSVGLLQVNPKVWHYTTAELVNPYLNAQIGGRILASYVHRYGLKEGLHHYNGMGDSTDEYSVKVLTHAGMRVG